MKSVSKIPSYADPSFFNFKNGEKMKHPSAQAPWINIVVSYCCTRVLLYAKMLKETKTRETIVFFVTFLSLVPFQLRRRAPAPPPDYAYEQWTNNPKAASSNPVRG